FTDKIEDAGVTFPDRDKTSDFPDIFAQLGKIEGSFNVVIDEYPYLKKSAKSDFVDSVFQTIVDTELKNIRLFLLGSDIGMMKSLTTYDNALFGRASLVIELKGWGYKESSLLYPEISPYDKVGFFSVFGGTPYVNVAIDPGKNLEDNIKTLFLEETGTARVYVDKLLITGDAGAREKLEPLLSALGNGKSKYGELLRTTKAGYDYVLTNNLASAINLELIKKVFPINRPGDIKKASYEISDNALRFYYAFIHGREDKLYTMGPDEFYQREIAPSIKDFVSRRFEEICREYLRKKIRRGEYKDACGVGTFYFDDAAAKENGEYDVAVQKEPIRGIFVYDIYEVKYLSAPLSERKLRKETEDIEKIKELKIQNIGFFSINGFEEGCEGLLIDGDELYR
ncbi:MAG: DUF234 domain-containing protein, partial [Clostridia bacterium]|nr:DUF234 domain-containing protein [Clostridia bacterium]